MAWDNLLKRVEYQKESKLVVENDIGLVKVTSLAQYTAKNWIVAAGYILWGSVWHVSHNPLIYWIKLVVYTSEQKMRDIEASIKLSEWASQWAEVNAITQAISSTGHLSGGALFRRAVFPADPIPPEKPRTIEPPVHHDIQASMHKLLKLLYFIMKFHLCNIRKSEMGDHTQLDGVVSSEPT